jgi:hypothetical protein
VGYQPADKSGNDDTDEVGCNAHRPCI